MSVIDESGDIVGEGVEKPVIPVTDIDGEFHSRAIASIINIAAKLDLGYIEDILNLYKGEHRKKLAELGHGAIDMKWLMAQTKGERVKVQRMAAIVALVKSLHETDDILTDR